VLLLAIEFTFFKLRKENTRQILSVAEVVVVVVVKLEIYPNEKKPTSLFQ
jgi:hypothetical protein